MVKDFRHRDISVGDTVVYPGRHSSSLWMNEAVVLSVHEPTPSTPASIRVQHVGGNGRAVRVSTLTRVAVVDLAPQPRGLAQLTGIEKTKILVERRTNGPISAIRLVRNILQECSLMDAKHYVDGLR